MTEFDVPPAHVVTAFGLHGDPVRFIGGEGRTVRVEDAVLKPVDDIEQAIWIAELISDFAVEGIRLPKPLRSAGGEWIVNGFSGWSFVEGTHESGRWEEIIKIGDKLHRALKGVPRPAWMDTADDIYRHADQFTWGEGTIEVNPFLQGSIEQLEQLRRPITLENQIIHCDLTGNVLFADPNEPAVIDFTPYWRPSDFSSAVIAVDGVQWEGAPDTLLDVVAQRPSGWQLIIRATLFRSAITAQRPEATSEQLNAEVTFIEHLVERYRAHARDLS